jgi:hydroxymethylglutaryl-CoA reductase
MPSGIDNQVTTYVRPIMFKGGNPPVVTDIDLPVKLPLVIGYDTKESLTAKMMSNVSEGWLKNTVQLNANQKLLSAITVTIPEQSDMVRISHGNVAIGTKMTDGGGGGAVVALCLYNED